MTLENNIIIYQTEDGRTSLEVRLENENIWLTANQICFSTEKIRTFDDTF